MKFPNYCLGCMYCSTRNMSGTLEVQCRKSHWLDIEGLRKLTKDSYLTRPVFSRKRYHFEDRLSVPHCTTITPTLISKCKLLAFKVYEEDYEKHHMYIMEKVNDYGKD